MRSTYRRCRFLAKKKTIIFSDEAYYDLGGYVQQAKLSCLGHRKPASKNESLFGPENEQGEAVIVNDDCYRAMLNEFLFTKIEEEGIGNIWFQQDGATCHTAEATLDVLRPAFEDRIISPRADVVWPPWSCQNCRIWAQKIRTQKPVTVWSRDIIGPFFFEATLDILRPVFEDRIISPRADIVWPPRSCD